MNKESKQQLKADAARSAKAAAGAAVGATIADALGGQEAAAAEIPTDGEVEIVRPAAEHQPQPASAQHQSAPRPDSHETVAPEPESESRQEVEVLSYERTATADGTPMDLAVVSVDGQEIAFLDADLDGRADLMLCDANGDGRIDNSEMVNVQADGIDMQPLQVAAGFNTLYADNSLPDYVSDGPADTFFA